MNSFGATLKREREARGIPLEEISEKLKIGVRLLKSLEDEQLAQLPGGIFNKSFLRQYARYLGLDEDQIISEYLKAVGAAPEPAPAPGGAVSKEMSSLSDSDDSRGSGYPRLILTAILVGLAVGAVLYRLHQFTERRAAKAAMSRSESTSLPNQPAPSSAPEASNPADATPAPAPPETLGSVPPSTPANSSASVTAAQPPAVPQAKTAASGANEGQPPVAPVSSSAIQKSASAPAPANPAAKPNEESPGAAADATALQLQIDAHKDCWISVDADGQMQWQGTLQADRSKSVQARDSFRLKLGDAGAVTLILNGKPLPSLGHSGEVKTVTISAKGLAQAEQ